MTDRKIKTDIRRCPDCDAPLAVDNNHEGGCECDECCAMCWREWNGDQCNGPKINWRERALKAEADLATSRSSDAMTRVDALVGMFDVDLRLSTAEQRMRDNSAAIDRLESIARDRDEALRWLAVAMERWSTFAVSVSEMEMYVAASAFLDARRKETP